MKIYIKKTNIKPALDIDQYAQTKLGSLEHFLPDSFKRENYQAGKDPVEIWVVLAKPSQHHQKDDVFYIEAQIKLKGRQEIRAEVNHWNLRLGIDELKDELQRQLKSYKEKAAAKFLRGARLAKKELRLDPEARFYRKGRIREEGR